VVGIAALLNFQVDIGLIADSPAGLSLYDSITAGSPGAAIAPREYPPNPLG
jgi:hypothetical protein